PHQPCQLADELLETSEALLELGRRLLANGPHALGNRRLDAFEPFAQLEDDLHALEPLTQIAENRLDRSVLLDRLGAGLRDSLLGGVQLSRPRVEALALGSELCGQRGEAGIALVQRLSRVTRCLLERRPHARGLFLAPPKIGERLGYLSPLP